MAERSFKRVNVTIFVAGSPSLTVIDWEFNPSVIPLSRYEITIYRGESPTEMTAIGGPLKAAEFTEFEDRSARLFSQDRIYYYKVFAKNLETGTIVESATSHRDGLPDIVGNYVVEEHNFLFKQVIGLPSYVYKKQKQGEARCSNCWDPVLKRTNKSTCYECHGTGFAGMGIGGYYNPTYTWIDYSANIQNETVNQWGKTNEKQADLFMSNYPRLSVGDVIVELLSDRVWKVFMVRETERRRSPMLQIIRADQCDKDSVESHIHSMVPDSIRERARKEMDDRKYNKGY